VAIVFKNNASTTLSAALSSSATSISVADATKLPSITGDEYFFCTIDDGSNVEIVKVTGISSNTLTVVRAQDNTTALSFSSGDIIEQRLTAAVLETFPQLDVGELTADEFIGDLRGAVVFNAQAGEAIDKGEVVYVSGISGNTPVVALADADDANKMPAFGLALESASLNNSLAVVTFGTISGVDTDTPGFSLGDTLYVSTTPGGLTNSPPAGESSLIQNIGKVQRVHASSGSIKVGGAGRTNAVPNLNDGNIFIGNASNQATTASLNTKIEDYLDANGTTFPDNIKAQFGVSNDLQIYHNGTHSYIDETGTGDLRIKTNFFRVRNTGDTSNMIIADQTGAVTLYHNGDSKLATTSTGIDVTGVITTDGLTTSENINFGDGDKAVFGAGNDLQVFHDSLNSYIVDSGTGNLYIEGTNLILRADDESRYLQAVDGASGYTALYHPATNGQKLITTSSGIDVTGSTTSTGDVGFAINSGGNAYMVIDRSASDRRGALVFSTAATDVLASPPANATIDWSIGVSDSDEVSGDKFYIKQGDTNASGSALLIDSSNNATFAGTISSGAITSTGNLHAGDGTDISMDAGASGQLQIDGNGYDGAIALDASAMHLYHNSSSRSLVLGTNETARLTIGGTGGFNFHSNNLSSVGTINSGAITSTGSIQGTSFSDGTISGITFIDEDSFATNSATRVPTQQSIKAYVDAQVAGVVDSAPSALNTLNELAAALGDDANFSTTTSTALGNRLRVDTAAQGLTGTQQANAITNLGITATKAELNYVDGVTSNIQTQLNGKQATGNYLTTSSTFGGDVSGTYNNIVVANNSHEHSQLYENGTIDFGASYVQWTDQSGAGGTGLDGAAPRNPANGWYHNLIFNHANSNGYYSQIATGLNSSDIYFTRVQNGTAQAWQRIFADDYHPNADTWTTARTITLGGDLTGNVSIDGSANVTLTAAVVDDSHNHVISNIDNLQSTLDGKTSLDHFRSLGTTAFTGTSTTAGYISEMESDGAFDSYTSAFKTSWSYAGNFDISDAGTFGPTETAGMAHLTWTDNSSDSTRGNITVLAIAPNTGGSAGGVYVYNDQGSGYAPGWREIWTSSTDGPGSGLDADLLDSLQSTSFLRSDAADTATQPITLSGGSGTSAGLVINRNIATPPNYYSGMQMEVRATSGTAGIGLHRNGYSHAGIYHDASNTLKVNFNGGTVTINSGMGTLWGSGNDGSGSGLDADLLDGLDSTSFARKGNVGYQPYTDLFTFSSNSSGASTAGDQSSIQIYNGTAGNDAFMAFHVSGDYAAYFGLDGTTNDLFWGGWSRGAAKYRIWHAANDGSGSGLDADLLDGINSASFMRSDTADSFTVSPTFATAASGTLASRTGFSDFLGYNPSYGSYIGGGASNAGSKYIYAGGFMNDGGTVGPLWRSTNDGSGSGLDADLLDGVQGSGYYRHYETASISNYDSLTAGAWSSRSTGATNIPYGNYNGTWHISDSGVDRQYQLWMGDTSAGGLRFRAKQGSSTGWHSWEKVWTDVNDGSGSGLDADLLDGINSGSFLRSDTADSYSDIRASGSTNTGRFISSNSWGTTHHTDNGYIQFGPANSSYAHIYTDRGNFYFNVTSLYASGNTMWHAGNDGSGSGLDADTVDGQHLGTAATAQFAKIGVNGGFNAAQGVLQVKGDQTMNRGSFIRWANDAGGTGEYIYSKTTSPYDVTIHSGSYDAIQCPNTGSVRLNYNGSQKLVTSSTGVSVTGDFVASGNVTAYSDKNKKKNIRDLESATKYLNSINPKRFAWKDTEKEDIGFIAQDVEKAGLHEFVSNSPVYNSETALEEGTVKTLDYSKMVSVLWKAVQEQQEQIESLKSEINNLKGE
jgi:hypothetical protein